MYKVLNLTRSRRTWIAIYWNHLTQSEYTEAYDATYGFRLSVSRFVIDLTVTHLLPPEDY